MSDDVDLSGELSTMMHMLKGTLTVLVGYSEMLTDPSHGAISPAKTIFAERVQTAARDLRRQLSNISMLGHLETATMSHAPRRFDLYDLLIEQEQLEVTVDAPRGLVVEADRANLGLVLENLVSNAVRHAASPTPSRGMLDLSRRTDAPVRVSGQKEGDTVTVTVHNVGPRIPEPHKALLFTRFGRLPGHVGIGLGLYVVKSILEAHGSRPTLSDTEHGTLLSFSLPAR